MKIKSYDTAKGPPRGKDGKYLGHLAVMTDATGEAVPVFPGMVMLEVLDPTRPDLVTPLILLKVTRKGWYFKCACKRKGCTRGLRLRVEWGGRHVYNNQPNATSNRLLEEQQAEVPGLDPSGEEIPEP